MKKLSEFKSEHSERVEDLKRQIKEREAQLQAYRREHGKLENFFDEVIGQIEPLTPLPGTFKPGKRKGESIVVPVSQATDWHIGEVQEPYEIEEFNEFNYRIACDRVLDFTERYIDWVTLHRNVYNINEAALLVTGDMISGDIHDELKVTNEFPTPVQVVKAAELLAQHLALIAPHFEKLTVHFITEDNHARLTKKPQAKEAALNSFNYLVGKLTEAYTRDIDNLEFNLYPMLEKVVNVNGMRYLISHGHGIRGWMGRPWYGIERRVEKESQSRLQLIMDELERAKTVGFDKFCMGHFHTPFDTDMYCCGGSLSGTSAYDHQNGRFSVPSQPAWMVHEKHKEFNRINFKL